MTPAPCGHNPYLAYFHAGIQAQVNFLFQNCKLEPAADAALHVLISEILSGAAAVAAEPAAKTGSAQLLGALRKYPDYFDHPNWQPIPAPSP